MLSIACALPEQSVTCSGPIGEPLAAVPLGDPGAQRLVALRPAVGERAGRIVAQRAGGGLGDLFRGQRGAVRHAGVEVVAQRGERGRLGEVAEIGRDEPLDSSLVPRSSLGSAHGGQPTARRGAATTGRGSLPAPLSLRRREPVPGVGRRNEAPRAIPAAREGGGEGDSGRRSALRSPLPWRERGLARASVDCRLRSRASAPRPWTGPPTFAVIACPRWGLACPSPPAGSRRREALCSGCWRSGRGRGGKAPT